MLTSLLKYAFLFGLSLLLFVLLSNLWVVKSTKLQIYNKVAEVPAKKIGLVLGANPKTRYNSSNLYFDYRIDAAWKLYSAGKVKHLLVSGDNHRHGYNEPEEMKVALMKKGVPESAITMDFAGFRTLDSVVRSKEVFQLSTFTVISQQFHNHRALFIARQKGLDVVAFNAKDPFENTSSKTDVREYLARCKAVLDLYVLKKQARFLGDKIDLPE